MPVSRQGRKNNFSGPKQFYFLSPEAGQQARKEKKLFRPQKVLFSIARGRSAGKEGKQHFQAPKSFIFYRQRPVSRQGRKKKIRPQKVLFSIARGPLRGLTAQKQEDSELLQKSIASCSAIMSERSPPMRKKRKDRSDSDLKNPARYRGSWKKLFGSWTVFSLGLDPGKKAHKLLSSFELTR